MDAPILDKQPLVEVNQTPEKPVVSPPDTDEDFEMLAEIFGQQKAEKHNQLNVRVDEDAANLNYAGLTGDKRKKQVYDKLTNRADAAKNATVISPAQSIDRSTISHLLSPNALAKLSDQVDISEVITALGDELALWETGGIYQSDNGRPSPEKGVLLREAESRIIALKSTLLILTDTLFLNSIQEGKVNNEIFVNAEFALRASNIDMSQPSRPDWITENVVKVTDLADTDDAEVRKTLIRLSEIPMFKPTNSEMTELAQETEASGLSPRMRIIKKTQQAVLVEKEIAARERKRLEDERLEQEYKSGKAKFVERSIESGRNMLRESFSRRPIEVVEDQIKGVLRSLQNDIEIKQAFREANIPVNFGSAEGVLAMYEVVLSDPPLLEKVVKKASAKLEYDFGGVSKANYQTNNRFDEWNAQVAQRVEIEMLGEALGVLEQASTYHEDVLPAETRISSQTKALRVLGGEQVVGFVTLDRKSPLTPVQKLMAIELQKFIAIYDDEAFTKMPPKWAAELESERAKRGSEDHVAKTVAHNNELIAIANKRALVEYKADKASRMQRRDDRLRSERAEATRQAQEQEAKRQELMAKRDKVKQDFLALTEYRDSRSLELDEAAFKKLVKLDDELYPNLILDVSEVVDDSKGSKKKKVRVGVKEDYFNVLKASITKSEANFAKATDQESKFEAQQKLDADRQQLEFAMRLNKQLEVITADEFQTTRTVTRTFPLPSETRLAINSNAFDPKHSAKLITPELPSTEIGRQFNLLREIFDMPRMTMAEVGKGDRRLAYVKNMKDAREVMQKLEGVAIDKILENESTLLNLEATIATLRSNFQTEVSQVQIHREKGEVGQPHSYRDDLSPLFNNALDAEVWTFLREKVKSYLNFQERRIN